MSKIIFTAALHKRAKEYGLAEPEYLVYAAMRASGIGISDAWNTAFQNTGLTWTKDQLHREQQKLENIEGVKRYIAEISASHGGGTEDGDTIDTETLAKETSKEKILSDLVVAKSRQKPGTKEWNETVKMIADYNRIKQDDVVTEDTTIHYYLPADYPNRCEDCLIWRNGKALVQKKG